MVSGNIFLRLWRVTTETKVVSRHLVHNLGLMVPLDVVSLQLQQDQDRDRNRLLKDIIDKRLKRIVLSKSSKKDSKWKYTYYKKQFEFDVEIMSELQSIQLE